MYLDQLEFATKGVSRQGATMGILSPLGIGLGSLNNFLNIKAYGYKRHEDLRKQQRIIIKKIT